MKAKTAVWKSSDPENPYNLRRREYDQLIGEVQKERNRWRGATFAVIILLFLLCGGVVYLGSLPKLVPHVIEVAAWGEARDIGPIGTNSYSGIARSDPSIQYYLRLFIKNTRAISSDPQIVQDNLSAAFRSVTQSGFAQLREDVVDTRMLSRALSERVTITVHNILTVTDSSYQIDWTENTFALNGEERGKAYYRGIFTVVFAEPNELQKRANPLGIFIERYDIQKLEARQ